MVEDSFLCFGEVLIEKFGNEEIFITTWSPSIIHSFCFAEKIAWIRQYQAADTRSFQLPLIIAGDQSIDGFVQAIFPLGIVYDK